MTVEDQTGNLLATLTTALQSATSAFPDTEQHFLPPSEGISLLDIKNDLLLSYLQNLVFLVVLKLRNGFSEGADDIASDVVKKLVELRVYLERGVRPLESKLKYQIDKVVRAAEEADRRNAQKAIAKQKPQKPTTKALAGDVSDEFDSDNEESDEDDAQENGTTTADFSAAPRPAALLKNAGAVNKESATSKSRPTESGAYRPPRITPTAMPTPASQRDREAPVRKRKSQLLDEYIDEELSTAPRAQPSIGSNNTIVKHGRGAMSTRDRESERERAEYEERNFVRLPAESKAERRKARLRGESGKRDLFGGEDWTGLGGLGDRINRTVAGRSREEKAGLLERRQKRGRDTQDAPRGDGVGIGETFEKRRKVLQQRSDKKSRRKG
jgi:U3 small nucleolar ribonucleoprotein protein LCP5